MHPFGGTHICPTCAKAVYAAEQVMGPGRKLYHKPCLACTICNKRLDSLTLLEHDQQPYCKMCHTRNFGTRDLRLANLPRRPDSTSGSIQALATGDGSIFSSRYDTPTSFPTPSPSPTRAHSGVTMPTPMRTRSNTTPAPGPILRPNKIFTARRDTTQQEAKDDSAFPIPSPSLDEELDGRKAVSNGLEIGGSSLNRPHLSPDSGWDTGRTTNTDYPLSPIRPSGGSVAMGRSITDSDVVGRRSVDMTPLSSAWTGTGTRYGAALSGGGVYTSPSPRKWGGTTPSCPRCGQSVYFAEQVKAVGKTYHKRCLRCTECDTALDSNRLTEKDGNPLCRRCYSKLHGPQGNGYALLGKAGG